MHLLLPNIVCTVLLCQTFSWCLVKLAFCRSIFGVTMERAGRRCHSSLLMFLQLDVGRGRRH